MILFRYKNLTNKYYAVKLLRHIIHLHLTVQWKAHLEQPPGEQKLEKGKQVYQYLFCTQNIKYFWNPQKWMIILLTSIMFFITTH